jgi:cyclic pyranopterin phosphate synthase
MSELSHFNERGEAHMVDVSDKPASLRVAIAEGCIRTRAETVAGIEAGDFGKGDVLGVARIAGIMAAKRTADLVPLCHPVPLTAIDLSLEIDTADPAVRCQAKAETRDRTGVEMEALTAVQVALLTIYDMCKSVERGMVIDRVRLVEKRGGKSGTWREADASPSA